MRIALTSRRQALLLGKMLTTRVRRLIEKEPEQPGFRVKRVLYYHT
jgi:hypothetical protein